MSNLYQKYRPHDFAKVVNQNHIKITLENQIKTNKLGHAYLFCGPRAVGKTTMSRVVAKAINCKNRKDKESNPCNKCSVCEEINNNAGLDIIEIDAASHTGVDNVRENIINTAQIAPSNYKHKVFIIDEVHMLSISAFNALLKIMEEPPKNVVFILCTTETHKVPETIISRCQRFDFKKISIIDITKKLEYICGKEKIKVDKKVLEAIARHSGGHMRDAESALSQVIAIGGDKITTQDADLVIPRGNFELVIDLVEFLVNKNPISAIELINNAINNGIDLRVFSEDLIETLRKITLAKISPKLSEKLALELGESIEKRINTLNSNCDINFITKAILEFQNALNEINHYAIPQLPVELAIISVTTNTSTPAQSPGTNPPLQTNNPNTPPNQPSKQQTQQATTNAPQPPQAQSQPPNTTNTQEQPPATPPTPNANVSSDTSDIAAKWSSIVTAIYKNNPSTSFVLKASVPNVNNDELTLSFKHKFHKDQADRPETQTIILEALKQFYSTNFSIKTELNPEATMPAAPPAAPTQDQTPPPTNTETPPPSTDTQPAPPTEEPTNSETTNQTSAVDDVINTLGGKVVK